MSVSQKFTVVGMTCGHCVNSVTEEVSSLNGVSDVKVTLENGELSFTADHELTRDEISAAVTEAGYSLAE
jgi:copper ion binding protein